MGEAASRYADFVIITNDNPRCEKPLEIARDIEKGVSIDYEIILDRKEAIKKGIKLAKKLNAILFILGKGDERYMEFCNKKVPFNDRDTVKSLNCN